MAKKDYENFLNKIDQLNQLVELINNSPEKYQLIISCKTHEDVVELAKQWGYEIGKRWGES
ncbi:Nif11 family protein [Prochlorococcus marinus]|uniref:Nif11 family protein n=1 Tax=Prochlorococcus marinus TaxID=1219 RepID=UPI0022B469DA|nr:Nif11 family protein [Prochlorococcus marinus]